MTDENTTLPPAALERRPRSGRTMLAVALAAFLVGIALAGWLVLNGKLTALFERQPDVAHQPIAPVPRAAAPLDQSAAALSQGNAALGAVETRLALMEERMSRLDLKAEAASGNAARAEALLAAFAIRRKIDSGQPLGYLEDQLRLRFGDAQPNAVQTIIAASKNPVTLDQLLAQLVASSSDLASAPKDEGAWSFVKRELSNLVVLRRDTTPSPAPENRVERARLMLASGKVAEAVAEVERLPGAPAARGWIDSARRYAETQRALDLIETTAMLEPYRLQDGSGQKVEQVSPLAEPVRE
jgi:exonuclease VII small subunit